MKSLSCGVFFPAWVWGFKDPSQRFIFGTYAESLSLRDSVKCRRVIQSDWFASIAKNLIKFQTDQNLKTKFENTDTGFRLATSVGGVGTGERADYIGFDDPTKVQEAESESARYAAIDWWSNTMGTRGSDPKSAKFLGIAQRTHYEDVPGHCLDRGYDYLILPAEYVEGFQVTSRPDLLKPGMLEEYARTGLLWPDQYGHAELARFKEDLGSYTYAAQFQQSPVPREGGIVKLMWFQRYKVAPDRFDAIVLSVDTAQKAAQLNDPWAALTWGILGNHYYLLDCHCHRYEYPEGKRAIANIIRQWRPRSVLIEDASSGASLIQEFRKDYSLKTAIMAIAPCGSKVTRMSVASAIVEALRVYLPEKSDWVAAYESELASFPRGSHDDRVDATSQFLAWAGDRDFSPRSIGTGIVEGDRGDRMRGYD
jgi:predicted phage terminase large subunit-like protein